VRSIGSRPILWKKSKGSPLGPLSKEGETFALKKGVPFILQEKNRYLAREELIEGREILFPKREINFFPPQQRSLSGNLRCRRTSSVNVGFYAPRKGEFCPWPRPEIQDQEDFPPHDNVLYCPDFPNIFPKITLICAPLKRGLNGKYGEGSLRKFNRVREELWFS